MHLALTTDDTIVAIASARGAGLRGVIRLSGPRTMEVCGQLFGWSMGRAKPGYRHIVAARLDLPAVSAPEGKDIHLAGNLLIWPDRRSFTGQPSAEWHLLAPLPLLDLAVQRFVEAGARLARPGEFTLRAFLAGRLDLSQAEAVLGVIHARDDRQFEAGLRQLAGGLATPLATLRESLLCILADLEAGLDFADEDIEFIDAGHLRSGLTACLGQLERLRNQISGRGDSGECPTIVLTGAPNAGKSSLFNALVGEQAGIVSAEPGTTRDWLERRIVWHGQPIRLVDTAGLDESFPTASGSPEDEARLQTARSIDVAQVVIVCVDGSSRNDAALHPHPTLPPDRMLLVRTKADLPQFAVLPASAIAVSAHSGSGIESLRSLVVEKTIALNETGCEVVPATLSRSASSLDLAASSLRAARDGAGLLGDELVSAEIRAALAALGEVTGAVRTDDLLDRIFSRFCLGK